jgi:hypothetical protein
VGAAPGGLREARLRTELKSPPGVHHQAASGATNKHIGQKRCRAATASATLITEYNSQHPPGCGAQCTVFILPHTTFAPDMHVILLCASLALHVPIDKVKMLEKPLHAAATKHQAQCEFLKC